MNLDEVFGLEENSLLVSLSPLLLLGCAAAAVLTGWLCVLKYRDTYNIEKSIKLYIPFALAEIIVFTILGVPVLFSLGAELFGLAMLVLISNRYFKK